MQTEAKIEILNWEKYQFRKEVKNPSWFRLENRMWNDQQFFYFSAEERWVWVCLLSLASQKQSPTLSVNLEWLSQESRVGIKSITDSLQKLKNNQCLEYVLHPCNMHVQVCNSTRQDITRQDKTRQTTICTELNKNSVTVPTVGKKELSNFINTKLLELYPQEYLDREKVKMEMWLATNQHKKPKTDRGMVKFVTGWLSRGWENYRRGLQSAKPREKTMAELLAEDEQNGSNNL